MFIFLVDPLNAATLFFEFVHICVAVELLKKLVFVIKSMDEYVL